MDEGIKGFAISRKEGRDWVRVASLRRERRMRGSSLRSVRSEAQATTGVLVFSGDRPVESMEEEEVWTKDNRLSTLVRLDGAPCLRRVMPWWLRGRD